MKPGSLGWKPGPQRDKGKKPSANEKVAAAKGTESVMNLRFPSDLGEHHMLLKFYEYDYSKISKGDGSKLKASIALPLPTNIVDQSRLELGGRQVGVTGGLAQDIANTVKGGNGINFAGIQNYASDAFGAGRNMVTDATKGDFSTLKNQFTGSIGKGMDVGVYLLRAGVGKVSPQIEQGLGSVSGSAMNPQTTLVFDGVDLKIHNFEWLFSPKNQKEADELDKINQLIQYYIHPDYKAPIGGTGGDDSITESLSRGLLTYPALMEVSLQGISGGMAMVFRTGKFLMVNNYNIDYTPAQGVVLNKGGSATMVRCSMNTTESRIRTKQDFRYGAYTHLAGPKDDAKDAITLVPTDSETASNNSDNVSVADGTSDSQTAEAG